MATPLEAWADLEEAVKTVPGLRIFALDEVIDPPGAVVEPPVLTPMTACPGYNEASFTVVVVVAMGDARRVVEALLAFVGPVMDAIENETPAAVTMANPGTYRTGATELPAYELTVQYPL